MVTRARNEFRNKKKKKIFDQMRKLKWKVLNTSVSLSQLNYNKVKAKHMEKLRGGDRDSKGTPHPWSFFPAEQP